MDLIQFNEELLAEELYRKARIITGNFKDVDGGSYLCSGQFYIWSNCLQAFAGQSSRWHIFICAWCKSKMAKWFFGQKACGGGGGALGGALGATCLGQLGAVARG